MTFGHNGFLGYSPCSSSANVEITLDHIRGKSVVPEGDMAIWWARSVHEEPKVDPDMERAKKGLAEKMASWRDPNIRKILEHSLKTVMIPQYVLPKQKTWAGRRVVLVGDAAHGKLDPESSAKEGTDVVQLCRRPKGKESRNPSRMQRLSQCCWRTTCQEA